MKTYVKFSDSGKKSSRSNIYQTDKGGFTFYNGPISPLKDNEPHDFSADISLHFKDRIAILEKENVQLRSEISMQMNEKEKFDYFLRLRKDMIEEIQNLKNELVLADMSKKLELDKMAEQVEYFKKRESSHELEKKRITSGNVSNNSEYIKLQQDRSFTSNQKKILNLSNYHASEDKKNSSNKNLNSTMDNEINTTQERDSIMMMRTMSSRKMDKSISNNNDEDPHYQCNLVISELKDRTSCFETSLSESKKIVERLKEEIAKTLEEEEKKREILSRQLDMCKNEIDELRVRNKTLFDEFSETYLKKEADLQSDTQENFYNLEKKCLYYEQLCNNLSTEIELIKETNSNLVHQSEAKCKQVSDQNQRLIVKYEEMYKTYEEDLILMAEQILKMKQVGISREKQMLELKSYYFNAIEEFKKPILEIKKNRFEKREEIFITQQKEIEELRNDLERNITENAKLKVDIMEAKPTFRKKFTDSSIKFENFITEFSNNHMDLETKLQLLQKFMVYFEEKFTFFHSIIEDKKKLEEKCQSLECKIKMFNSKHNEAEYIHTKQLLIKATKDVESRNELIKNLENHLKGKGVSLKPKTPVSSIKNINNKSNSDPSNKFSEEIATLTIQITNLSNSKDSLEKFYTAELKSCLDIINEKSTKLEYLTDTNKKMENDYFGKKETIFNLWMLEFNEFKAKLLSVNELKAVCSKFDSAGDQLRSLQKEFLSEELMLLRNEVRKFENHDDDYKIIYTKQIADESKIHKGLKQTVEERITLLDDLNYKRHVINEALLKEKELIQESESKKLELINKEENLSKEEKSLVNSFFKHLVNSKEEEINELRTEIDRLNSELLFNKETFRTNFEEIDKSVKNQISLIKERENFTVRQFNSLEDKFNNYMIEKDRIIYLQKEELDDMQKSNRYLSKLKFDRSDKNDRADRVDRSELNRSNINRSEGN